jgi:hypothetical protein
MFRHENDPGSMSHAVASLFHLFQVGSFGRADWSAPGGGAATVCVCGFTAAGRPQGGRNRRAQKQKRRSV